MRNSRLRGQAGYPDGSNSAQVARSQRIVHGVGESTVHALDDVGVGVEDDGGAGVAQGFVDVFWVLACHEEYCSAGVAEIMGADPG
jgi:hypothetical protein